MRYIFIFLLLLAMTACSSDNPQSPNQNQLEESRVVLSDTYLEDGNYYVDIRVENVVNLYQFSMRLEFNPNCVKITGFEPSIDFTENALVLHQPVVDIPQSLRSDMLDNKNHLYAIAVTRPFPQYGSIEIPNLLGRIKVEMKCNDSTPFTVFNRKDYLVFRDHEKNPIDVIPAKPLSITGGSQ